MYGPQYKVPEFSKKIAAKLVALRDAKK